jgi:two-component system LytT family response regulator
MINALIIDDEQHCINALVSDLSTNCKNVSIIGTCSSAQEGIISINKLKPQLVFLNIEMPGINGFEMLELLPEINFSIIFATAYDKFAARAFRVSAIDFLLKPIDAVDLVAALQKVEEKMHKNGGANNIRNLLHNIHQPEPKQKVALPSHDGYEFVPVESIVYCSAEGAYTRVVLKDKNPLLISKTLGDIEEILPANVFIRIHHSTIVNLSSITHYSRTDGGYVIINMKEKLVVSKGRKEALLQQLGLK